MSIEDSAIACGIPIEEVIERATGAMAVGEATQWQFLLVAQRAIACGLSTLEKIAKDGPRYEMSDGGIDQHGMPVSPEKLHNTDLEAAKALATLGINAAKVAIGFNIKTRQISNLKPVGGQANDLFDLLAPNPWDLKKIDG